MRLTQYVSNCPNCGAPLRGYGKCEYCGTAITQPLQIIAVRPGMRKLVCQTHIPLYVGEKDAATAAERAKIGIRHEMADALTDSIKFLSKREFDPIRYGQEVITIRGELWVADPDIGY